MQFRIILILTALLLTTCAVIFIAHLEISKLKEEKNQLIDYNLTKSDSLKYYKSKDGQEVAVAPIIDLTTRNARALQTDERVGFVKKFKGVNKRLNNVEEASRTEAIAKGKFKMNIVGGKEVSDWSGVVTGTVTPSDSSEFTFFVNEDAESPRTFNNNDKWFNIKGTITKDSIEVIPYVPIPLEEVRIWERKHKLLGIRFGRKIYTSQITSPNPYVKIISHEVIRIGKKK
jgi:cell division protein FtsL